MRDDFDIRDTRVNEDGDTEYLVDGDWYTDEDLDDWQAESERWRDWARDLDRQDDPDY